MTKANVAFVINKSYIGQFKVTFYSLVKSNRNLDIFVHLLHNDLEESAIDDIENFVHSSNAKITFYKIDDKIFEGLPKMGYDHSYTAYYKTLLPNILSSLNEKVLFLDCDIIVRGEIESLFQTEQNAFLSCVEDFKISQKCIEHKRKIMGEENIKYFNSGVMLFNFSQSYEIAKQESLVEFISQEKENIRWHDQDILNHFYAKECCYLEEKYNYLATYKSIVDVLYAKGKKEAVIVHYANWKPWNINYIGKFYNLYKKHYYMLRNEKYVDFLRKRKISVQLKLIFYYLFRKRKITKNA